MEALEIIRQHAVFDGSLKFLKHLHGGDINRVYAIEAENQRWVVKENDAGRFPEMLQKEFNALFYLHKKSSLVYPRPRSCFSTNERQFLVINFIEKRENNKKGQQNLGKNLAQQHRITNEYFGWEEDNYVGSLPQNNTWCNDWNQFFAENRLLPLGKMAFDKALLSRSDIQRIERLCFLLKDIFTVEQPSLLHGDLWHGNYFIGEENQPVLFDPAVYFGHREMDIAMTQLFGGFSIDFIQSYLEEYPLIGGWENRLPYYQLYPNLVHLNLFGEHFLPVVKEIIHPF